MFSEFFVAIIIGGFIGSMAGVFCYDLLYSLASLLVKFIKEKRGLK